MERFGICYIGVLYMILLITPNIIWTKHQPEGYTSQNENKILLMLERIGEVLITICAIFHDITLRPWNIQSWWLVVSFLMMICYEIWWIRYFRSAKKLEDFYRSFLFLPVGGATLPVLGFLFLGIYGNNIWMIISVIILGIGHIGIHLGHAKEWTAHKKS